MNIYITLNNYLAFIIIYMSTYYKKIKLYVATTETT